MASKCASKGWSSVFEAVAARGAENDASVDMEGVAAGGFGLGLNEFDGSAVAKLATGWADSAKGQSNGQPNGQLNGSSNGQSDGPVTKRRRHEVEAENVGNGESGDGGNGGSGGNVRSGTTTSSYPAGLYSAFGLGWGLSFAAGGVGSRQHMRFATTARSWRRLPRPVWQLNSARGVGAGGMVGGAEGRDGVSESEKVGKEVEKEVGKEVAKAMHSMGFKRSQSLVR